jgi:S-methylmethionine-dependent homocysteine/selenocysteine methylase
MWLSHAEAESEFMGACKLMEEALTEKHCSSRIVGGCCRVDNPIQKSDLSWNLKKMNARSHRGLSNR